MISYQMFNEICALRDEKGMSVKEIALCLRLDKRTAIKWTNRERYEPRKVTQRASILDPYKSAIRRDWELGGNNCTSICKRISQAGYTGGQTIIKEYVRGLRRQSNQKKQLTLPFEWMLRLVQGDLTKDEISIDFGASASPEDIAVLVQRVSDGPLRERNKAVAILANIKNIPRKDIVRFLIIDPRVFSRYVRIYKAGGIVGLFKPREGRQRKHTQEEYKYAVFALLHTPPQAHDINRTSWRMDDLLKVLHQQGITICKEIVRHIIKDAGFRFRQAKRVLTSTDPKYREKLKEITRILSGLTESQKFFSIDEFGPFSVKMQGGRALTAPDQERIVPQWQRSKGSLTLIGALELSTNQMTQFYAKQKNTVEMIKLLHLLVDQYHDESLLYLSWDAASWHASKAFLAEVARINENASSTLHGTPSIALAPLPSSAQFLNVIESVFSGMARAIIHNSDYASVDLCKAAIDRYFVERNEYFKAHPKRAGDKIWGEERVPPAFNPINNCKDPMYR